MRAKYCFRMLRIKCPRMEASHPRRTRTLYYTCWFLLRFIWGTSVALWLRCCATNWKVTGSIPDGFIGIFHWHNTSDRTMALGSTQPLTEMNTRRISWGKCGRCVRLTTLQPPCTVVMKSENLNFLEPSGPLQACNGTALPFTFLLWFIYQLV